MCLTFDLRQWRVRQPAVSWHSEVLAKELVICMTSCLSRGFRLTQLTGATCNYDSRHLYGRKVTFSAIHFILTPFLLGIMNAVDKGLRLSGQLVISSRTPPPGAADCQLATKSDTNSTRVFAYSATCFYLVLFFSTGRRLFFMVTLVEMFNLLLSWVSMFEIFIKNILLYWLLHY